MSGSFRRENDPIAELGQQLRELQASVRDLQRPRPFTIPIVSVDPPESDPTNLWLMPDGRLRGRHQNTTGTAYVYREWVSTTAGSGSSGTAPAPPDAAPTTRYGAYGAQWSQSYRQSGPARTDAGTTRIYYGSSGDAFNGRNRSLIGFDYAAIAADLAGSTINWVKIRFLNLHSYNNSGSEIHFGIHNFTSEPASWGGGGIPQSMTSKHAFGKTQERTVNLPIDFAASIRDGWGKGIAVESPNDNRAYYGYGAGVGSGYQVPVLEVEYVK